MNTTPRLNGSAKGGSTAILAARQRHDGGRGENRSGGLSHGDRCRRSDQRDRDSCEGE